MSAPENRGGAGGNPFEAARPSYARVRPAYPAAAVAAIVRAAGLNVRGERLDVMSVGMTGKKFPGVAAGGEGM